MLFTLFSFVINDLYLLKTPIPVRNKIAIFLRYSFYTLMCLTPFIPKPKTIKVYNYTITGLSFSNLHYLMGEIFVKNEYFFVADTTKPIILDCGSNIGVSVIYFKYLYPDSHIYAFEPDPETFRLLEKNVKSNNLTHVTLHNCALSDKEHEIDFYISHEPGSLMMSALKGRMSDTKIRVKAISLGEFISGKDIDFMKMDIEGSEGKVLMDIVRRGEVSHIKELIMEYHNNISDNTIPLSKILELLETQFKYQVDATSIPIYSKNKFQDVLVLAFKNENMPQT